MPAGVRDENLKKIFFGILDVTEERSSIRIRIHWSEVRIRESISAPASASAAGAPEGRTAIPTRVSLKTNPYAC